MASNQRLTSDKVSVATYFLRPLRRALDARGREPSSVLAPFGLTDRPATRIPFETAAAVWSSAAVVLADPGIGLHAARMLVPGDYGALEFAARSSPTLRAAIERIARYHRLLNDRGEVLLQGRCMRYLRPGMEASMPAPYVEFVLASWARTAHDLAERSSLIERVFLPHGPPADDALHREVFRCEEIRFGMEEPELHFAEGALDAPLPRGDRALASVLDRHAEALLEEIARGAQWTSRVSAHIERRLADGTPRLEDVAQDLGISPRMLRRRLEGENTTFARVVDDIRRRLALKLTAEATLSLGEIAFFLGFSEPSAFHRAFRRWTGRTPRSEEPSPA